MRILRAFTVVCVVLLVVSCAGPAAVDMGPSVVTVDSPSPLLQVRLMVGVGSAYDPAGKEGLASMTANALIEGGYGDPEAPVTKDDLADLTMPWGAGARPQVFVDKQSTTLSFTVPRDELDAYVAEVFRPLLTQPLFAGAEIDRLREESLTGINQLRFENLELVGLEALDNLVHEGTSFGHSVAGSVEGLSAITRDDIVAFFDTYYQPWLMTLGVSSSDAAVVDALREAVAGMAYVTEDPPVEPVLDLEAPAPVVGRSLTVVGLPNAGAAGVHVGFPLPITRSHPDWWALNVANIHFGTHRDSHSYLYERIRSERGYNYGDYSYIEHFPYRPFNLFQPWNAPRDYQYFSMWVRPVGTQYAHHILKSLVYELDKLVTEGLSEADVERSKNKARVLYLNLAENTSRLVEARVDDSFYEMSPGHLEGYLERIDAVTTEQVNEAIRRYLQVENLKMLVVTEADEADKLAADIGAGTDARGKSLAEYNFDPDNLTLQQEEILALDVRWENTDLGLAPDAIQVVTVGQLFQNGSFAAER